MIIEKDQKDKGFIRAVVRIGESPGVVFAEESDVPKFIETPLVEAITTLLRKGIKTISSNASLGAGDRTAYISLDANTLSDENKEIARQILQVEELDPAIWEDIYFELPITEETLVEDVQKWANTLAEKFVKQPAIWQTRYPLAEIKKWDKSFKTKKPAEIAEASGMYLAPDGFFYQNEHSYHLYVGDEIPDPSEGMDKNTSVK